MNLRGQGWALGVALVLSACSAKYSVSDSGGGGGTDESGDGSADGGEDSGASELAVSWWALSASLVVLADDPGEIDPLGSMLEVRLFDEARVEQCASTAALDVARTARSLPDPAVYGWWELTPGAWTGTCDAAQLAERVDPGLELGVGVLDAEIKAQMGAAGLGDAGVETLNGAYVSLDSGDTLWVYGVAGLPDAFTGAAGPATETPIPGGTWALQSVYSLPWGG